MSDEILERGLKRMRFKAYRDTFEEKNRLPAGGPDGFEVLMNPETFDRTLNVNKSEEKTARPGNSSGHDAGLSAETYAFDLIFDGTGVAGPVFSGKALDQKFQEFLTVVYATQEDLSKKKSPNLVKIEYCGMTFGAKLDSMSIKYLLFHRDGYPLRIKASCHFSSVEESKPEEKKGKGKTKPKKKTEDTPPVKKDSSNAQCCCACPTYGETVSSAKENKSVSLMSCNYTQAEMTPNYTPVGRDRNYTPARPELNYTPADGRG